MSRLTGWWWVTSGIGNRRRPLAVLCAAVSIGLLAPLLPVVSARAAVLRAPADDIEAKRAEARAIQDELDVLGERASLLDEELNIAVIELTRAEQRVEQARALIAEVGVAAGEARAAYDSYAVELYVGGGSGGAAVAAFDASTPSDLASRVVYSNVLAEANLDTYDRLVVLEADLNEQRSELEAVERDAQEQRDGVDARRVELQQLLDAEQEVLSRVEGELAQLVAAEEARRRAEEERRAREEAARLEREAAARRAAEEQARRARQQSQATATPGGAPGPSAGEQSIPPPPPASPNAARAIEAAQALMGTPYRFGASGPESFDCSGFTAWVWREAGVILTHSSRAQYAALPKVPRSDLQPGDLVFFGSPIHHVGLYVGGDQMIDAPRTGSTVGTRSINRRDYAGASRPG